jgi:hypothetical protein
MKTAMQELIERLSKTEKQLEKENNLVMSSALYAAKNMALEALEKEKEQIMDAYCDGAKGGANGIKGQHENGWVSIQMRNKYYNQTYNN